MHSTILCVLALSELFPVGGSSSYVDKMEKVYVDRLGTCIEVANVAEEMGVSQSLMVSLGFEESRFDGRVISKANARGPLQVIPRWGCPKGRVKNCDLVRSGVAILKRWLKRYKTISKALCHYNSGNKCNKRSRSYARRILRRQHRLKAQMKNVSYDFEQE